MRTLFRWLQHGRLRFASRAASTPEPSDAGYATGMDWPFTY